MSSISDFWTNNSKKVLPTLIKFQIEEVYKAFLGPHVDISQLQVEQFYKENK